MTVQHSVNARESRSCQYRSEEQAVAVTSNQAGRDSRQWSCAGYIPGALEEAAMTGAASAAGAENCAGPHLRAPELRSASWGSAGCEAGAAAAAW